MNKKNLLAFGLLLISVSSICSCSSNPGDAGNQIYESTRFVGHGVDFSNGQIGYQLSKELYGSPDTFECLIRVRQGHEKYVGVIFSDRDHDILNSTTFEINENGNFVVSWNGGQGNFLFDEVDLRTGEWEKLAFVRDEKTGLASFYLNGNLVGTRNCVHTTKYVSIKKHEIGVDPCGFQNRKRWFQGEIKAVNCYTRALSVEEIREDCENMLGLTKENRGSSLLLSIALAPLKDKCEDKSGYHNHAKLKTNFYYSDIKNYETKDYTLVGIPDPQLPVEYHEHRGLDTNMDYFIQHKEDMKIEMVMCVGDIVNCQVSSKESDWVYQYTYAEKTFNKLNNKVDYIITPGNHDYDDNCQAEHKLDHMNKYFPRSRFESFSYFGGGFDEIHTQNTYYLKECGGVKYCFICLDFGPSDDVLEWANQVAASYPDRRVIVNTHCYIGTNAHVCDQDSPDSPSHYGWNGKTNINDPNQIFEKFVSKHSNIFMTICGHIPTEDLVYSESIGDNGNVILNVLACASGTFNTDSIDPVIALLDFDEKEQTIGFDYYSTYYKKQFNIQNHFTYSFKGNTDILSSTYYNADGTLKEAAK